MKIIGSAETITVQNKVSHGVMLKTLLTLIILLQENAVQFQFVNQYLI